MSIRQATLTFQRDYPVPPAAVFAAFGDKQALLDWSAPGEGWEMSYEAFDFRVGHTDVGSFGPIGEPAYRNTTHYTAIEPGRRLVYASALTHKDVRSFDGLVAAELEPHAGGTRLKLVETGFYFDDEDGPQGHEAGWNQMLDQLGDYLARRGSRAARAA
jgi:uncharacterized protein YndB with AHSA1/START domain